MPTSFPAAKRIRLPELTLEVHEAGSGPAVVMCHGFPELAYSWRYQVNALAAAGFRAIAPNQRGYGWSDAPARAPDYSLDHLCDDMAHLLDALGIDQAVFAGHDWGGFVSWGMTVRHPDRCLGAIGVNTPYMAFPTTEQLRAVFKDDEKLYILWFQKPGIAEGVLDKNPRLENLLLDDFFAAAIRKAEPSWRHAVAQAVELGLPVPGFAAALTYFDGYRRDRLPANLLQAQRDYFGAHTYQRIDKEGTFHTDWIRARKLD